MAVRITTLSENTAQLGFIGEWGLSILVETESHLLPPVVVLFSSIFELVEAEHHLIQLLP